ncbi:MAG: acylneuraminate cytidylyltransferase family protein [Planctomycetes bacterium]|nr:acylneuraminate cytidylyltransferase family protein [Planctomycetota bacterium]
MKEKKILFLCCARNGSKEVAHKNIAPIAGKPLMHYTLELIKKIPWKSNVVLSTDGDPIASSCRDLVDYTIDRPSHLADDQCSRWPVLIHALEESEQHFQIKYDYIFDFLVTAPFRKESDILACYDLVQQEGVDNVITGVKAHRSPYFNMVELRKGYPQLVKNMDDQLARRQDAPPVFDMNGSVYAWKREALIQSDVLLSPKTRLHIMPEETSLDVDTAFDLKCVDLLMKSELGHARD